MDRAEFNHLLCSISNWGRWGEADRAGTLNLVGGDQSGAALRLAAEGATVSLARPIGPRRTSEYGSEFVHFMTGAGSDVPSQGMVSIGDWMAMGLHGRTVTHLDAHSHMFWDGQTYNGLTGEDCTASRGTAHGGIEPWFGGVVARGVLVDIPLLRGVDSVDPREPVRPEELDRWFSDQSLKSVPGDLLVVRTGTDGWPDADIGGPKGSPGLDLSCLEYLRAHDVAVLASDATHDVSPGRYDFCPFPVHTGCLTSMGMWLIDNADLRPLVAACAGRGRYEFCCVLSPMKLKHATGSPINPIAIF